MVKEIMEMEAPISKEELLKRLTIAKGVSRINDTIKNDMFRALKAIRAKKNTTYNDNEKVFFWLPNQSQQMQFYRIGGDKPRAIVDIPKEELFVAIKEILLNYGPMFKGELKSYVAKIFNIKTVGTKVDYTLEMCIEYYINKKEIVMVDNNSRVALRLESGNQ